LGATGIVEWWEEHQSAVGLRAEFLVLHLENHGLLYDDTYYMLHSTVVSPQRLDVIESINTLRE
jgi:hypothetical protein